MVDINAEMFESPKEEEEQEKEKEKKVDLFKNEVDIVDKPL